MNFRKLWEERAASLLPTLVKFELRLVQLFGLGNEVDVRPPWLPHVLEHCGLSACRTSLSTQTLEQYLDTSGFQPRMALPVKYRGWKPLPRKPVLPKQAPRRNYNRDNTDCVGLARLSV